MLKPLCYSLAIVLTPIGAFAQTMVIKTSDELISDVQPIPESEPQFQRGGKTDLRGKLR